MKELESIYKYILIFIIMLSVSSISLQEVDADMGPKPMINLYVEGLDVEYYYLDLLVDRSEDSPYISYHISSSNVLSDSQLLEVEALLDYQDIDDYYLALLEGTWVPMHGHLLGTLQTDGSYLHKFSYLGVPEDFKIIILTSEGDILVSGIIHRDLFQSEMIYDLSDFSLLEQELNRDSSNYNYEPYTYDFTDFPDTYNFTLTPVVEVVPYADSISAFFLRMVLTITAEVVIAYYIFKFRTRRSLGIIVIFNIVTQLLLNIIIFTSWNSFDTVMLFLVLELFVLLIEFIGYYLLFKEGNKYSILKYTLTANLATLSLGLIVII